MTEIGRKKRLSKTGKILGIFALVIMIIAGVKNCAAVKRMSTDYHTITESEYRSGDSAVLVYDDGLYAQLMMGIDLDDTVTDMRLAVDVFARNAVQKMADRAYAAGVLYVMIASSAAALFIYELNKEKPVRHVLLIISATVGMYILFDAVVKGTAAVYKVPFPLPSVPAVKMLALSLLSVIGGGCALGLVLRKIKYKKIAAVAAIPLIFMLFLLGAGVEAGLYNPKTMPSFDYVVEIVGEENLDKYYYDEEKNAIVGNGEEYPPEIVPNPEYTIGAKRMAGLFLTAIYPYAGNSIELLRQELDVDIPLWAVLLHTAKSIFWIGLAALLPGRKQR